MTLFAGPIFDGTANVNHIAAVSGSSHMTATAAPHLVAMGMPVLANVVLESEVSPPIMATVTAVQ